MKNALDWIKSNPISAASIVAAFIGVIVFLFVLFVQAPALRARVVEANGKQASDLNAMTNARVELPNPDPNEPPLVISNLVINREIIDFVDDVYREVEGQSDGIKRSTSSINARAHENFTFVGGTLFGEDDQPTPAQIVAGSEDYRNSFDAMFQEGYQSLNMPKLLVGMPPDRRVIDEALFQTLADYLQSVGAGSTSDLTQAQAQELYQLQQVAVMTLLTGQAKSIQLYADALPIPVEEEDEDEGGAGGSILNPVAQQSLTGMARYGPEYPFQIADWAFEAEQASLDQLWEGQVQIWITRDLMQAIALTNSDADQQRMAVIDAPIKRLLELEVLPGYVGLHSGGGVNSISGSTGNSGSSSGGRSGALGRSSGAMGPGAMPGPVGPGMSEPGLTPGGVTGPGAAGPGAAGPGVGAGATAQPEAEVSELYGTPSLTTLPGPQAPIVDSFFFGPTGRYSNSVFDVRHARLKLHMEWSQIPAFIDTLRQVNFMSVINMSCTDIDEYNALASGYVYGTGNVVEVEFIIETLWYRSWTTDLMPQVVKNALLVVPEVDDN